MSAGSLQHLHAGPGAKLPQPAQRRRRVTHWLLLFVAIVAEVVATSTLKATEGFTRLWPSVIVVVCYETAFILMSLSMKKIPVGIVYAVWSGVGVALITLAAWIFLGQTLDAAGLAGVALIVGGVVVINAFSKSVVD
jgi:small multidrug resistance pump